MLPARSWSTEHIPVVDEERRVMKSFRFFQIVRRGNGRFYWLFVSVKGRRRRVLARSTRDYSSAQKAAGAIDKLRGAIVLGSIDEPFRLPETSFHRVPGVLPLVVDEFPVEDSSQEVFHAMERARKDATDEPTEEPAAAEAAAKPPTTPRTRKPTTRRGSRASRAA
jgi:hypothetical protein